MIIGFKDRFVDKIKDGTKKHTENLKKKLAPEHRRFR